MSRTLVILDYDKLLAVILDNKKCFLASLGSMWRLSRCLTYIKIMSFRIAGASLYSIWKFLMFHWYSAFTSI